MSDLIQRLREAADEVPSLNESWAPLMREAADEIKQLEASVAVLTGLLPAGKQEFVLEDVKP